MSSRVLIFCHEPPSPPKSGLNRRCLELACGFREAGCDVTILTIASNDSRSHSPGFVCDADNLPIEIIGYTPTRWDRLFIRVLNSYYFHTRIRPPIDSAIHTPLGLRRWFRRQVGDSQADAVVIVYAMWAGLLKSLCREERRRLVTAIDTIDLTTLNQAMQAKIARELPPNRTAKDIPAQALHEQFFQTANMQPANEEFRVYDKFDFTIAINRAEAAQIVRHARHTRTICVPMTMPVVPLQNDYSGAAVFVTGPNIFNVHACYYLARRVLPKVCEVVPEFTLDITGACGRFGMPDLRHPFAISVAPPSVRFAGFVDNLSAVYQHACFAVCPVLGGTGQLVKVIEAMAHGLAVVALAPARERVPIRHGIDGFLAHDANEFAALMVQLWRNRAMCRRIGEAARARIERDFNRQTLVHALQPLTTAIGA